MSGRFDNTNIKQNKQTNNNKLVATTFPFTSLYPIPALQIGPDIQVICHVLKIGDLHDDIKTSFIEFRNNEPDKSERKLGGKKEFLFLDIIVEQSELLPF